MSMGLPSYETAIRLDPRLLQPCVRQPSRPSSPSIPSLPIAELEIETESTRSRPGIQVTPKYENQFRKSEPDMLPGPIPVKGNVRRTSRPNRGNTVSPAPSMSGMLELAEVGVLYSQVHPPPSTSREGGTSLNNSELL